MEKNRILDFIAKTTGGQCYTSYKFCYDGIVVPSVAYDEKLDEKICLNEYGEENHSPHIRDISKEAKQLIALGIQPLFRFFLDGSRKVYKIDDIEYGNKKIYPIVVGQVGVACCERVDKSHFKMARQEKYIVLSLPDVSNADGHNVDLFFNSLATKINDYSKSKNRQVKVEKILPYSTKIDDNETLENRAIAKIQDEMVECEKKIVAQLANENLLNHQSYLMKDGTLQYKPMKTGDFREISKIKNNYRSVVGVSKSFNPELMKDKNGRSNAGIIAKLELYHRTPAFMYEPKGQFGDVKFAVWYVRIRDKHTATPFSGILKIEKMLVTADENENGLRSDEVDLITANVINERSPVCFGSDNRWANHLYPVYLTEKYCKSQYISDIQFLNLF